MTKILNHINTYADLTAYDNDKEKNFPNISYIQDSDEVKWVKDDPVHIVCKLNVTSTSKATKLLGSNTGISYQIIDGIKQDAVQTSYTFDTLGEHIVKYKLDGTSIVNGAFTYCDGLTSVTIGNGVTSIGSGVFYFCSSLTNVTIPDSVTSIGSGIFEGCKGLTSIVVDSANTVYDSRDNCNAIVKTSTNELIAGCKNTVIPNSVTSIGDYAIQRCSSLKSITIPSSVTNIGNSAFYYCEGLTSITIPDSVTNIGNSAFRNCEGLTSVTVEATTPPTLGSNAFDYTNNCPIYCPAESVNTYKTATNWKTYASRIKPITE